MSEIVDLRSALIFLKGCHPLPDALYVRKRPFVRIKRDINKLRMSQDTPFSRVHPNDRWLWHERKRAERHQIVSLMGVQLKISDDPAR